MSLEQSQAVSGSTVKYRRGPAAVSEDKLDRTTALPREGSRENETQAGISKELDPLRM